jgi:type IV secretion system protein VirD4
MFGSDYNTYNEQHRHGSARAASADDIRRAGFKASKPGGLFSGFCPHDGKPMFLPGDGHCTVIGGAGAGKGAGLLNYTALGFGWDGPALLNDLKGELAALSIMYLHSLGISGYFINPFGIHAGRPWYLPKHRFNPLDILSASSQTLTADIKMIMEMLIKIPHGSRDDFFEIRARQWCEGLLKFMVLACGAVTLPDFYRLINLIETDPERFRQIAEEEMMAIPSADVQRTAQEIVYKRQHAEREFSSVIGTIFKNFAWLDDPALRDCLSGSDFSLDVLTKEKARVFLIVPAEYAGVLSSFLRLTIGVAMIHKQRRPDAPRVLYLIDEAGQLGYFEMLERAYTFGRGAGIRALGVFQSLGQMNCYPAGAQTILGSSAARIFMGTREYDTARLVSNMIGNQTLAYDSGRNQADAKKAQMHVINSLLSGGDPFLAAYDGAHFSQHAVRKESMQRALITPDEVLSLPDERMIVMTSGFNCPPIFARKIPYYMRPEMAGRFMPNPHHPPYDRVKVKGIFGQTSRRIVSEKVPSRFAHWPQFQQGYWSRVV